MWSRYTIRATILVMSLHLILSINAEDVRPKTATLSGTPPQYTYILPWSIPDPYVIAAGSQRGTVVALRAGLRMVIRIA